MNTTNCICLHDECPINCNELLWNCQNNICQHKDFFPFQTQDIFLIIGVFFISFLASIAGIGGGALLLPFYMLVGNFKTYYSIPLCVVTIAGNSLCRMLLLIKQKHPSNKYRFLINYIILIAMIPLDNAFSFVGYFLNTITPAFITNILLIILLLIIGIKTIKKSYFLFRKENKKIEIENTIIGLSMQIIKKKKLEIDNIELEIDSEEYEKICNEKKGDPFWIPVTSLIFFALIFITQLIITLVRNNQIKCSTTYWSLYGLQTIFLIIYSIIGYYIIKKIQFYRDRKNFFYLEKEFIWNNKKIVFFGITSIIIGIVSTYLGIGGGMIVVPFLLFYNISPEIASSTNAISTFFSSISSSIQFLSGNRILTFYGIIFFAISFFASFFGLFSYKYIQQKYNRNSILVFVLGIIIFLSFFVISINTFSKIQNNLNIKGICN